MENLQLREELDKIVAKDPDCHFELINRIRKNYNHKIILIDKFQREVDIRNYSDDCYINCYMYGFEISVGDINKNIIFKNGIPNYKNTIPDSDFVMNIIKKHLNKIIQKEAREGDYVGYFSNNEIRHAGRCYKDKIASKWGSNGHFWEHRICELPLRYGSNVKFYRKISKERILKLYRKWIKNNIS